MSDNVTLDPGAGGDTIRTKDRGTSETPIVGLDINANGAEVLSTGDLTNGLDVDVTRVQGVVDVTGSSVSVSNFPATYTVVDGGGTLSVDDGGGIITVDGTVSVTGSTVTIQDGGNVISVDDGAGSLTIDNPALSVVGGGVEAAALRVTIANDSTGVVSIDDNGGNISIDDGGNSITVDGSVALDAATLTALEMITVRAENPTAVTDGLTSAVTTTTPISVAGMNGVGVLFAGTYGTFTIVFQQSVDGGSTYQNSTATDVQATYKNVEVGFRTLPANATELWAVTLIPGATHFRIIAFGPGPSSGTCNVRMTAATLKTPNAQSIRMDESLVDNAAFTDASTKVLPTGFIFDEVAGTALTENDIAAARVDSKRAQVGVIEDATTRGQRAAVSATGRLSVDEQATATDLAALPSLLKVAGTYDADQKMVHPFPVANVGDGVKLLVADSRVRNRLKEMELVLIDIRDILSNQRT